MLVGAEAPERSEGLALGVCVWVCVCVWVGGCVCVCVCVCVCDISCLETAASTQLIGR